MGVDADMDDMQTLGVDSVVFNYVVMTVGGDRENTGEFLRDLCLHGCKGIKTILGEAFPWGGRMFGFEPAVNRDRMVDGF